jgi:hypothetical protein
MSFQDEIDAIRGRIAQAQVERDSWRAAGREEKYLEAYVTVEALEMQLDARLRDGEE